MKTKKQATTPAQYTARVQIVGGINGEQGTVPVGDAGDHTKHAVFTMAESGGFERGFAETFLRLARASREVKYYRLAKRPSLRSIATNYVREKLGVGGTVVLRLNGGAEPPVFISITQSRTVGPEAMTRMPPGCASMIVGATLPGAPSSSSV